MLSADPAQSKPLKWAGNGAARLATNGSVPVKTCGINRGLAGGEISWSPHDLIDISQ